MTPPSFPADFTIAQLLGWLDEAIEEASRRWAREHGGERFREHFAFAMPRPSMVCDGIPEARLAIVRVSLPESDVAHAPKISTSLFAVQVGDVFLHAAQPTTAEALFELGRSLHAQELDLRNLGEHAGSIQCQVDHQDPSDCSWMFEGNFIRIGGEHIRAQRQAAILEKGSRPAAPAQSTTGPRL